MAHKRHSSTTHTEDPVVFPLQMNATMGAPLPSSDYAIHPCNWVQVYGRPGLLVDCTLGENGKIIDGNGATIDSGPYPMLLDGKGWGEFRVVTTSVRPGSFNAYASDSTNRLNKADTTVTFFHYQLGVGAILAYAYTTSAPADGESQCTFYAIVDRAPDGENPISKINVTLDADSSAVLQNTNQLKSQDFPLNPDGSVAVAITDTVAEDVGVIVYLPESGNQDELERFTVQFVTFPVIVP